MDPSSNQTPERPTKPRRKSPAQNSAALVKKPRTSKPKVRSGCITCKARRVKCDEKKPGCARCEKFGRVCDGYGLAQSQKVIHLQPRIPSLSLHIPTISPHRSDEEHRYFEIFRTRAAFELSGYYKNSFWHELVLQESHHLDAIRHAVIALGALNESLNYAPPPDYKVNILQTMDKVHHYKAVQSYTLAVQRLNYYLSNSNAPQLRRTLIACLLIICFETIKGSIASSVSQTYGGLKILRQYYLGPESRPWIPAKATLDRNARQRAEKISQAIISRLGCDGIYKQRAMIMHVEDYLAGEHEKPPLAREPKPFLEQTPGTDVIDYPVGVASFPKEHRDTEQTYPYDEESQSSLNDSGTPSNGHSSDSSIAIQSSKSSTGSASIMALTPSTLTPKTLTPVSKDPLTPPSSNESLTTHQVVIRKRKRPPEQKTKKRQNVLQNDQFIEDSIFQCFVRLDGQGLFFGTVPGIPPLIWDIHSLWHLDIPLTFLDFGEAQHCWDFLIDRAMQFYRRTFFDNLYQPANSKSREEILTQHAMYLDQLEAFESAFSPLLDAAIASDGSVAHPAPLVLSLYQKLVLIMFGRMLEDSERVYDNYLPHFKYIVSTSALIIGCQNKFQLPQNPRFSFDIGIVPPLHVTATRCRDPIVRREAIALLFKSPRQEGMWDGILSARVGCWLVKQEEEGLPPPILPPGLEEASSGEMRGKPLPNASDGIAQARVSNLMRISEVVNTATDNEVNASEGPLPGQSSRTSEYDTLNKQWVVPLENRVQLVAVDYHVLERYIIIHGQKVVADNDGNHLKMLVVIGW